LNDIPGLEDTEKGSRSAREFQRILRKNRKIRDKQKQYSDGNMNAITTYIRQKRRRRRRQRMDEVGEGDPWSDDDDDYELDDDDAVGENNSDSSTSSQGSLSDMSSSSEDENLGNSYIPGFLDDPEMVQGRHRHVMVGDMVTGCVVSSTIQFVKPAVLKADLNKQFKERFDGWEPPKSSWKYIGAKVIDGAYTLQEDAYVSNDAYESDDKSSTSRSVRSATQHKHNMSQLRSIYMPPSLTLSKIRSVKQQTLAACVRANLEVSTVALACVYFERLCLDCRVDKSNRRLSFASCLLLAAKTNENNVGIVHDSNKKGGLTSCDKNQNNIHSRIRPTKKHTAIFASLLEFFTQHWSLSLKALFAAEWGVFAALGFSLHATPSQVAFHFKRLMKGLEWVPLNYLGQEMYDQWQHSLANEALLEEQRKEMQESRQKHKEQKLMQLQHELQLRDEASPSILHPTHISFMQNNIVFDNKSGDKNDPCTGFIAIDFPDDSSQQLPFPTDSIASNHLDQPQMRKSRSAMRLFRGLKKRSLRTDQDSNLNKSNLLPSTSSHSLFNNTTKKSLSFPRSFSSPSISKLHKNLDAPLNDDGVINIHGEISSDTHKHQIDLFNHLEGEESLV